MNERDRDGNSGQDAQVTRRDVLKGVSASIVAGAAPAAGATVGSDDGKYIVGTSDLTMDVAGMADEVVHELDFGSRGNAIVGRFPEEAVRSLRQSPGIRYVERDAEVNALGGQAASQELPWGIDRINADEVHDEGFTGDRGSVAIIDTGIQPDHEDLEVVDGEAVVSCSGSDCAEPWDDDNGHGTHCAGIAGARNNDVGVVGVAPEVDLYAVKVLGGGGSGSLSDVMAGIEWAADNDVDVASLSLGGPCSEGYKDAIQ